jgi:hypothetical protein
MSALKTYNADQVQDSYTLQVGTDGEATRSRTNNRSHTITLTLMQSSDINDLLSAVHTIDINSAGGAGIGPLIVKDGSGRALYIAEKCWVKKPPAVEFGREAGPREWVFETNNMIRLDAGN